MVDGDGKADMNEWAVCSMGCPGVDYKETTCDTEQGIQFSLPFSYMGHTHHGCLKTMEDNYSCPVKAHAGIRRVNCSELCPRDIGITEEENLPKEITYL